MEGAFKKRLRIILSAVNIAVLIPAVLLLGVFFGDRNYALTCTVIVVLAIVPFFLLFENKKIKVRELVPIAIMTAIAVAGRGAFYFLPQFKPIVAIVIITGVAFGCEAGFLCGSLSMLCSNFFFGQGPWTPWQMFACGLIGFISGFMGKSAVTKNRILLCVWGFVSCFIYGLFVDFWSLIGFSYEINWKAALSVYTLGLPFNLILAVATVMFLILLAKPLLNKLDRIKVKYGLIEAAQKKPPAMSEIKTREVSGYRATETDSETTADADPESDADKPDTD